MNINDAKTQVKNTVVAYLARDEMGMFRIPSEQQRPIFLIGALYYEMGEIETATQYISRLIGDQNLRTTDPQMYERARALWTDVREAGGGES